MFSDTFTADNLVAVLNAVNVPICFTVLVAGVVIVAVKRAFQRANDAHRRMKHLEDMERLRLSATRELTHEPSHNRGLE
jgi:hypothetical protein